MTQKPYFQPEELKDLLTPIMTAAVLAKQNALVIGSPGNGKTEILNYMLEQVYGEDATLLFPCVPSTLPADIIGYANPVYSIDPDAEAKGIPYWITKGTPVDESVKACLLDEVSRFGDLGMDTAVHAMHAISKFHRPVYVGTANWLTATPRNEALRDRFSFTVWHQPGQVDITGLIGMPAIHTWKFDLPTLEDIERVQGWLAEFETSDPANYKCSEVIVGVLEDILRLCDESGGDFQLNNRRIFQWRAMLYALGAYAAGSPDFEALPRMAYDALAYAYPVTSFEQAIGWRQIVFAIIDTVETRLAEFKANAYAKWTNVQSKYTGRAGMSNDGRDALKRELGTELQESERELLEQFPGDPRVQAVIAEMQSVYFKVLRGEKIG